MQYMVFLLGRNVLYEEAVHYQSHIVLPDPGDVASHPGLVDDEVHASLPPPRLPAAQVDTIKVQTVVGSYRE